MINPLSEQEQQLLYSVYSDRFLSNMGFEPFGGFHNFSIGYLQSEAGQLMTMLFLYLAQDDVRYKAMLEALDDKRLKFVEHVRTNPGLYTNPTPASKPSRDKAANTAAVLAALRSP